MTHGALWLVGKLVLVSAGLFILWQGLMPGVGTFWPGGLEGIWLAWQKAALRGMFGLFALDADTFNDSWRFARGFVLSVIPFLGLMIIAGPHKWKKRLTTTAIGLVVIGFWQLCTVLLIYLLRGPFGGGKVFFVGVFPIFMLSYSLPFVLWMIFSYERLDRWLTERRLKKEAATAEG